MVHPADDRRPRHAAVVRATHWVTALATLALTVSSIAILIAHPRLYWGETGAVGTPSLIDLPIPFLLGHSGWGRYLHFAAAWAAVASGVVYLVYGFVARHFSLSLVPSRRDLQWASVAGAVSDHLRLQPSRHAGPDSYNVLQRVAYATDVFLLGPLVLLSGLAFSPALAAATPVLVNMFDGQQSARTIHFFAGMAVVGFLIVHVVMVWLTGFRAQMRTMIVGDAASTGDHS